MPTAKKAARVDELQDLFQRANLAISTDYRGLKTAELTALRRRLRESKSEFHVVKNTLGIRAAEQAQRPALPQLLNGPTGLVLSFGDEAETARSLSEYIRTSRLNLPVRGGLLGNRLLQPADVQMLATLPPREVVLAQVMGGFLAPIAGFVGVLSAVLSGFVRVIDARVKQLEGAALPGTRNEV